MLYELAYKFNILKLEWMLGVVIFVLIILTYLFGATRHSIYFLIALVFSSNTKPDSLNELSASQITQLPILDLSPIPFLIFSLYVLSILRKRTVNLGLIVKLSTLLLLLLVYSIPIRILDDSNLFFLYAEILTILVYFLAILFFNNEIDNLPGFKHISILVSAKIFICVLVAIYVDKVEFSTVLFVNPAIPMLWYVGYAIMNIKWKELLLSLSFVLLNFQKGFLIFTSLFILFKLKNYIHYLILLVLIVPLVANYVDESDYKNVSYELRSFEKILNGTSPRAVELINIIDKYYQEPGLLLFGSGMGAYFEESEAFFIPWQRNLSAFTQYELDTGQFYKPHDFVNWLLLKIGPLLSILLGIHLYRVTLYLSPVKVSLPVLVYVTVGIMQSVSMAFTSVLLIFILFKNENKRKS